MFLVAPFQKHIAVLLDPNQLSEDGTKVLISLFPPLHSFFLDCCLPQALGTTALSDSGKYYSYAVSASGCELAVVGSSWFKGFP